MFRARVEKASAAGGGVSPSPALPMKSSPCVCPSVVSSICRQHRRWDNPQRARRDRRTPAWPFPKAQGCSSIGTTEQPQRRYGSLPRYVQTPSPSSFPCSDPRMPEGHIGPVASTRRIGVMRRFLTLPFDTRQTPDWRVFRGWVKSSPPRGTLRALQLQQSGAAGSPCTQKARPEESPKRIDSPASALLSACIAFSHPSAFNSGNSIRHQNRDHLVPVAAVNAKIGVQGEDLSGRFDLR